MRINLSEIPAEGRSYHFDRESGELNEILADLLEERAYDVKFTIRPLGNVYELKGRVQTTVAELCSRCGWDLELPVNQELNEILMKDYEDRKAKAVHGNHSVDYLAEGPDVTFYQGEQFEAGEFVHEAVALAQPFYPSCEVSNCEHLAETEAKRRELEEQFALADKESVGHPAFAALKNLVSDSSRS